MLNELQTKLDNIEPSSIQDVAKTKYYTTDDLHDVEWTNPEDDDSMSLIDKIGVSARNALKDTVEYSAFEKLIYESGILEADPDAEPTITPQYAKEDSGLELEEPVTMEQYEILKRMRDEKIELETKLGEAFDLDEPIDAALAFITYTGISMFTPVAHVSGTLVGSAAGSLIPIVGTGLGAAIGYGSSVAHKVSNAVKMARMYQKLGKTLKQTKKLVDSTHVARAAVKAKKFVNKSKMARAALAGATGNSMEESVIWWLEASKGHKTNLGARATFGFFAPVLLTSGIALLAPPISKLSRAIRQKAFSKDINFKKSDQGMETKYNPKAAMQEIKDHVNAQGNDADSLYVQRRLNEVASNTETTEEYLEALAEMYDLDHSGLKKALNLFGRDKFDKKMIDLFMGMTHAKIRPSLFELFPFLKNPKAFDEHLEAVAKRFNLEPNTANMSNYIDEIFSITPEKLSRYVEQNHRPADIPNKRGMDMEPDELKEINTTKSDEKAIEKFSEDSTWDAFTRFNKNVLKGIDDHINCLTASMDEIGTRGSQQKPTSGQTETVTLPKVSNEEFAQKALVRTEDGGEQKIFLPDRRKAQELFGGENKRGQSKEEIQDKFELAVKLKKYGDAGQLKRVTFFKESDTRIQIVDRADGVKAYQIQSKDVGGKFVKLDEYTDPLQAAYALDRYSKIKDER